MNWFKWRVYSLQIFFGLSWVSWVSLEGNPDAFGLFLFAIFILITAYNMLVEFIKAIE